LATNSGPLSDRRTPEFHTRLTNGSIAPQHPDGAEIVAAMKRARTAADGMVRSTETCYCPTPLQHERATVLDRYFTGIEARVIDKAETFDGAPSDGPACRALDHWPALPPDE
jgi:hypothetical protein